MHDVPRISDAEWEVMKVLWAKAPLTANEVIDVLKAHTDWSPKTVRTLLNRLHQKQAVAYSQDTEVYMYFPLVSEDECVKSETSTFLKRMKGAALKPLFVTFLKEEKLSEDEINELKKILDDKTES